MTGAIDIIRCEISKCRGLAAVFTFEYINMGLSMYVTLTNIPIDILSAGKGLRKTCRFGHVGTPKISEIIPHH